MAQSEAAREAHNAYMRDYRAKNKDKIKEITDRYWERKGAELLEHKKGNDETVTD